MSSKSSVTSLSFTSSVEDLEGPSRKTATKRALSTYDLIVTITSHLDFPILNHRTEEDYRKLQENQKTLYSLALTERQFTEPALDILWRNMDSLIPLLKLLPFIRLEQKESSVELSLKPTPAYNAKADWLRFSYYAPRIRTIRIHSNSNKGYQIEKEAQLYATLCALLQHKCFLPKVQTLILEQLPSSKSSANEILTQLPHLLLSSSLIAIEVETSILQSINHSGSFITILNFKAPYLRQFCLTQCNGDSKPFSFDPVPILPQMHHIQFVGTGINIDTPFLQATGRRADLKILSLNTCANVVTMPTFTKGVDYENWKLFPGETGKPLYHALESLELGGPLDLIHNFIGYVSSAHIRTVAFTIYLPDDANFSSLMQTRATSRGEFVDFITDVIQRWGSTLQSFKITFSGGTGYTDVQDVNVGELLFKPFVGNTNLRALHFVNFPGKLHGVAEYTHLNDTAPNLRSLYLPPQEKGLGIAEFRHLLSSCPHLKDLAISLDFASDSDSPPPPTNNDSSFGLYNGVLEHSLEKLSVLAQCPSDTFEAARQLDDIFPNLVELKGMGEGWDGVQNLLRLCQYGRRRTY
ncbi:hypothetical protein AX16_004276 [Volvariella volvacea WC 439]|nr:hypothetical protein AX16_004276 [Volvariella volvacea WC 439]